MVVHFLANDTAVLSQILETCDSAEKPLCGDSQGEKDGV
jgi:hypothetical protein